MKNFRERSLHIIFSIERYPINLAETNEKGYILYCMEIIQDMYDWAKKL